MTNIRKLSIIGGEGNFGTFMGRLAQKTGFEVQNIIQAMPQETASELLQGSDVVIFSVPIRDTVETIQRFASELTGDKLVLDVTGIKVPAMQELRKLDVAEIVGTHPMFGPFGDSIKGKKIIVTPEKKGEKWNVIEGLLRRSGAQLMELTAEEHDTNMAVIQALTHFVNLVFTNTLQSLDIHPADLEALETPIYRLQALISGRFLNQSGDLYAQMQQENLVFRRRVLPMLLQEVQNAASRAQTPETQEFQNNFRALGDFLGESFLSKAQENTVMIDDLFAGSKK